MVAPVLVWLVLELISAAVLAATATPAPALPVDDPEWLVHANRAIASGLFKRDEDALWLLTPSFSEPSAPGGIHGGERLVVNEWGHRGPPMDLAKPPGGRRAMVLGGSHPYGMWVGTSEAYSSVLADLIAARGGPKWEVLNAACPGHTTFQGLQYLRGEGVRYAPDVVIFDLGTNDSLPLSLAYARPDHEVQAVPREVEVSTSALQGSAVYRLLRKALEGSVGRPEAGAVRVPPARRAENQRQVAALARERGFKVLFVSQVAVSSWNGPGPASCNYRPSEDGFVPEVDICGLFEGRGDDAGRFFVDRMHANPAGHRLIAEEIMRRMEELGWLD